MTDQPNDTRCICEWSNGPNPVVEVANDDCPLHGACVVCGAGPRGRCNPPDDFEGDCPHGCSPER